MGEVGLSEGHEAGVEISPDEEQQEGNRGEILIGDRVDHGEAEIDAEKDFGIGHPAGFVAIFLGDERVFLTFNFKFGRAREIALDAEERFEHGFGVADGDADAGSHDERHIEKSAPPGFGAQLSLRD